MALAQALEQQLGIQRRLELQLLTHRQHQFAQLVIAHQVQGLIHGLAVGPMPRATAQQAGKGRGRLGRLSLLQRARLLPQLFSHQARGDLPPEAAR